MQKTFFSVVALILFATSTAFGAFVSGSTGADGALNINNGTITVPPSGVLNYTTVNIMGTVTFTPNANNTPVYILATGDVTISGTLTVNGQSAAYNSGIGGAGGPGGFPGGFGVVNGAVGGGRGVGPGGGAGSTAGYATIGTYATTYGNPYIIPAIGGSGGGGGYTTTSGGGGGGGAIVIASSGTINVTGSLTANGGSGSNYGAVGSGGAIRLIANTITGNGAISATGATGGYGYIRLETTNNNRAAGTNPMYTLGAPGSVFGSNMPTLAITSIGGVATPATVTARYSQPDIVLPYGTTNPIAIGVSAANVPVGTTVKVRVIPQNGAETNVNTTLTGTDAASTGSVSMTIPTAYTSIITAEATYTVTSMMYEGEEIGQVRVATLPSGGSEVVYITKAGREIKVS